MRNSKSLLFIPYNFPKLIPMQIRGALTVMLLVLCAGCQPQDDTLSNWSVYKGDAESTSYSSLDQIHLDNVHQLEVAWTYAHDDVPEGMRFGKYECNPIVIDEIMYATSSRSWLYALDGCTGERIWAFDPFDGERGGGMKRGVTYWREGEEERILFTAGHFLWAIDAKTGKPIPDFGVKGKVNLNEGLGVNPDSVWVIPTSPGMLYGDLLILGSEVSESYDAAPGHIRAYDVRSGKVEWIFHTIPQPGEPGYETWPADAWKYAGGANNWGGMSLDESRGIVYAPLGSPTYDYYGANRAGKNLYGNSLVALDAASGELKWHFQTTHHDVWDYDLPAPPTLATILHKGKPTDAVTLTTKTGFLFVFDRETGEPLFPIEERPVPSSRVKGEEVWPTQPFPLLPKAYARQHLSETDLTEVSDETHQAVLRRFQEMRFEGLYTPPDSQGTLMMPGSRGGSEWGGTALDPTSGILYLNANESPEVMTLQQEAVASVKGPQILYAKGERYYLNNCAICHGGERQGQIPDFPALTNIGDRLDETTVRNLLQSGRGRMPAFSHMRSSQRAALLAFLFDQKEEMARNETDAPNAEGSYRNITAYSYFRDPEGYPAIKPPWGTLNAINLHTGEYVWKIPLGNYPERQEAGGLETGTENWGGPIVTAGGLVFIAATKDNKIRAFDSRTGDVRWEYQLPGSGFATPSTYLCGGRQYLVIAVSGNKEEPGGSIMAFALANE